MQLLLCVDLSPVREAYMPAGAVMVDKYPFPSLTGEGRERGQKPDVKRECQTGRPGRGARPCVSISPAAMIQRARPIVC